MGEQPKIDSYNDFGRVHLDEAQLAACLADVNGDRQGYCSSKPTVLQNDFGAVKADLTTTNLIRKDEKKGPVQCTEQLGETHKQSRAKAAGNNPLASVFYPMEKLRLQSFVPHSQDVRSEQFCSHNEAPGPADSKDNKGYREVAKLLERLGSSVHLSDYQMKSGERQASSRIMLMFEQLLSSEHALRAEISTLKEELEAIEPKPWNHAIRYGTLCRKLGWVKRELKKERCENKNTSILHEAKIQKLSSHCEVLEGRVADLETSNRTYTVNNNQLRKDMCNARTTTSKLKWHNGELTKYIVLLETQKTEQECKFTSLEAKHKSCKQSLQHPKHEFQWASNDGAFKTIVCKNKGKKSTENPPPWHINTTDAQAEVHDWCQRVFKVKGEELRYQSAFFEGGLRLRATYVMVRNAPLEFKDMRNVFVHNGNFLLDLLLVDKGFFGVKDAIHFFSQSYGKGVKKWIPIQARQGPDSIVAAFLRIQDIVEILNGRSTMHHHGSFDVRSHCRKTDREFEEYECTFWELLENVNCLKGIKTINFLSSIADLHKKMEPLWERIMMLADRWRTASRKAVSRMQ